MSEHLLSVDCDSNSLDTSLFTLQDVVEKWSQGEKRENKGLRILHQIRLISQMPCFYSFLWWLENFSYLRSPGALLKRIREVAPKLRG